ncbi:MAG: UDP-glucose 4-epimerase GalE [Clostridiales bacterium]|nr:UDP-glucose 4-epimerase GalE [Clostridiales bacterium]
MNILVTGGTGYIGSHTCVELMNAGHDVIVFDNLCNSKESALDRIEKITGKRPKFYVADMRELDSIRRIFSENTIDAVVHFAGLKAVGESVAKPVEYYKNNVGGTLNILSAMNEFGVKKFVFSSSATVYGDPAIIPITEECPLGTTTNPYGETKKMLERILTDYQKANSDSHVILLRYFNPIGAHESGLLGEEPNGIPNNLMPYIMQVVVGKLPYLRVFGNDYDTPDGTGVRDYIHVVDLAKGHVAAMKKFSDVPGVYIYNLGTGVGYSVLDIVHAFEKANDIKIPYQMAERRPGDIAVNYSDPSKAFKELGWKTEFDLERMCKDSYRFAKNALSGS